MGTGGVRFTYEVFSADRGLRFYNFLTYFPPDERDTVDYAEGVGHSAPDMIFSPAGVARLLYVFRTYIRYDKWTKLVDSTDNWSGNGSRAADFGPRQIPGDDPHPTAW
jgi:hypothetical protein